MELLKNSRYEVWTDSGWSDFDGLMIKGEQPTICIELDDGSEIECTLDHKIYTEAMIPVEARLLTKQHRIITEYGTSRVKHVRESITQQVYDIHNVHKNNRFYADGMLVSNCEFIIYSETLIDPLKLVDMEGVDPVRNMGQVRWYKHPHPDCTYVVSLDPSSGTGGDAAAIQVVELPTMIQVAEWQHNKTPVEGQMKCMMEIMQYLKEMRVKQTYWSVENNTIGEAALVVIRDTGEENFPGDFLHEPKKVAGNRARKGFHTGHKTKLEACLSLKRFIENDKLKICSKPLIKELKNFIAKGNSFSAQPGEHDDLVMSLVLAIRMINHIATFEDEVYDVINSNLTADMLGEYEDEWDGPMPIDF